MVKVSYDQLSTSNNQSINILFYRYFSLESSVKLINPALAYILMELYYCGSGILTYISMGKININLILGIEVLASITPKFADLEFYFPNMLK